MVNCEEAAKFTSTSGSMRVLLVLLVLGRATTQESSARHQEQQPGYGQNLVNRWPHAAKRATHGCQVRPASARCAWQHRATPIHATLRQARCACRAALLQSLCDCDRSTMRRTRAMVGPISKPTSGHSFSLTCTGHGRCMGSARTFDGLTPAAPGVHWGSR